MSRIALSALVALALILAVVGTLSAYVLSRPTEIVIAVSRMSPLDRRVIAGFADMLKGEASPVRLEIKEFESSSAAAAALDSGVAQMAVVRSDVAVPGKALSVAIIRREAAILVAPRRSRVEKVSDLAGKSVAVVRNTAANIALLHAMLDHNSVPRDKVRLMPMEYADLAAALRGRKVDAALLVGGLGSRQVTEAIRTSPRDGQDALVFVSVDDAAGIALRNPQIEAMDVTKGVFGGAPPRPLEEISTVGFLVRLVARNDVEDSVVSAFVRQLVARRSSLSALSPGSGLIEIPDADATGSVALHPGVRAYLEGTERSFLERYGDAIYIIIAALGLLGSIGMAIYSFASAQARAKGARDLATGLRLLDGLEAASNSGDLAVAAQGVRNYINAILADACSGKFGAGEIAAAQLMIEQLRSRLRERRAELER